MAIDEYKYLTPEQREHFLEHGWVKIPKAVNEEYLKRFTENVWVRLGYDPNDKSTWTQERIHMPIQRREKVETFAPKVRISPFPFLIER